MLNSLLQNIHSQLNVSSYIRSSSNIYQRGQINFRGNLYTLAKNSVSTFLYKILPTLLSFLNRDLIKCPMKGYYIQKNVIVDHVDPAFFRTFMATGDYKMIFAFINAATERVYIAIEISVVFKRLSTYLV
jgi:hypothetical protein